MNTPLLCSSIRKVSELLRCGSATASEVCEMCLSRIRETEVLNAFITITTEPAQQRASRADERFSKGMSVGVLEGVPLAIKDNWNTQDIRTTCASKMLSPYVAPYDSTVVSKLYGVGAVVVGKANLDEFAMGSATVDSYFGPCRNPWRSGLKYKLRRRSDLSLIHDEVCTSECEDGDFYVTGGSSGGSAVAVATGSCFGAISSDTGGSTRNPAALCGVVGLKPTYGLVSRHGLIPLCNSMDVPGIIARTVDDAALLLDCVSGKDNLDSTTVSSRPPISSLPADFDVANLNIGIPKEYECPGLSPAVKAAWRDVADLLASSGARVQSVSLPHTKYSIVCYSVLCCCDVASNFARYDGIAYGHRAHSSGPEHPYALTRREGFGEVVRERILAGNYFLLKKNYEQYFLRAARVRRLICEDFQSVFAGGIDLFLTPVTLSEPIPYREWTLIDNREHNAVDDFCTQPVNMAGLPAVSVPCRLTEKGLPVSLQLIGRPFHEKQMMSVAKWIESRMDFPLLDFG